MPPKAQVKKKAQAPPNGGAAPSPPRPAAEARPAAAAAQAAQPPQPPQPPKGEAAGKEYSPRTEGHVKQLLSGVLDGFGMSRADVAALVRRCHHDDRQIQEAVGNLLEERQSADQWEEKKTKKQPKAPAAPNGAPEKPVHDARVSQQLRVLEIVGTADAAGKADKKYSPRTEAHIKELSGVLDFFAYSRADVANLVRRCNYDEAQIQETVANIIEDRHALSQWEEKKTKKQMKEEKKVKEEEEKAEQERLEREAEKARLEAEKRLAREKKRQAREGKGGGKDSGGLAGDDAGSAALPPDPAILFAGTKPSASRDAEEDQWWEGEGPIGGGGASGGKSSKYWEWDKKDEGKPTKGGANWENGKEWDWQQDRWNDGEWADDGGKPSKEDNWWGGGDWDKASGSDPNSQQGRGKKVAKEKRGPAPKKVAEDPGEMWDMPDTNAAATEGGSLDQWSLGDIRAYEQRAGDSGKAPPPHPQEPAAMRTVEEIEREQLGATSGPPPPNSAPPGAAKSRLEALLGQAGGEPPSAPGHTGAPERPERGGGRGKGGEGKGGGGGKGSGGGGRGKGGKGDGGGGRGDGGGGEHRERGERPERGEKADRGEREEHGERGERGDKERVERMDRSDDPRRQAVEEVGENVTVRKHSSMGCAVVSLRDIRVREAIMNQGNEVSIGGIKVQMKRHTDKATGAEIPTDIFVAWGRQVEKTTPLSERELTKFFDVQHIEMTKTWRAEEEEKTRQQQERLRQQKLLEEQQRAAVEQRDREEQRRRYEEDLARRRQEEETRRRFDEDVARRRQEEDAAVQARQVQAQAATAQAVQAAQAAQVAQAQAAQAAQVQALAASRSTAADHIAASASGLNPTAAAYPNPAHWNPAANAQWMQALAYSQQQQQQAGWQQQMAARTAAMQMAAGGQMGSMSGQDYAEALRAQAAAAYHYQYMAEQQRGQNAAAYAAQTQQGAYLAGAQQNTAAFGYGAAAAYGGRGGDRL